MRNNNNTASTINTLGLSLVKQAFIRRGARGARGARGGSGNIVNPYPKGSLKAPIATRTARGGSKGTAGQQTARVNRTSPEPEPISIVALPGSAPRTATTGTGTGTGTSGSGSRSSPAPEPTPKSTGLITPGQLASAAGTAGGLGAVGLSAAYNQAKGQQTQNTQADILRDVLSSDGIGNEEINIPTKTVNTSQAPINMQLLALMGGTSLAGVILYNLVRRQQEKKEKERHGV